MREIKFRQPILLRGKFLNWYYWGFIEQYGGITVVGPETNSSTNEGAKRTSQQYTGLKDKNSKEIYEGDIVRHEHGGASFRVEFLNGSFIIRGGHHFYEMPRVSTINLEVIGNIYENPELLEPIK